MRNLFRSFIIEPPLWFIVSLWYFFSVLCNKGLFLSLLGVGVWSLSEYLFHRFVFHGKFEKYHRVHHMNPRAHVSLPLTMSLTGTAFYFAVFPLGISSGIFSGYILYEMMHRIPTVWHFKHHEEATRRFGVTCSFWDWVFRTL